MRKLIMFYAMALATTAFSLQASACAHLKNDALATTNSQLAISSPSLMLTGFEEKAATYRGVEIMDSNHKVMSLTAPQAAAAQSVERIAPANAAPLPAADKRVAPTVARRA